jgi:hypothetical protein
LGLDSLVQFLNQWQQACRGDFFFLCIALDPYMPRQQAQSHYRIADGDSEPESSARATVEDSSHQCSQALLDSEINILKVSSHTRFSGGFGAARREEQVSLGTLLCVALFEWLKNSKHIVQENISRAIRSYRESQRSPL